MICANSKCRKDFIPIKGKLYCSSRCSRTQQHRKYRERRRSQQNPMIYFIVAEGCDRVKIGKTKDLVGRLQVLRSACPLPLHVLGFISSAIKGLSSLETKIHNLFADYAVQGEWFILNDEVRERIYSIIEGI